MNVIGIIDNTSELKGGPDPSGFFENPGSNEKLDVKWSSGEEERTWQKVTSRA